MTLTFAGPSPPGATRGLGVSGVVADHDGEVIVGRALIGLIDMASARAFSWAAQSLGHRGRQLTIRSPSRLASGCLR